jgi:RNA-directed DNA polymerase
MAFLSFAKKKYDPPAHVFGFVTKRSHIDAVLAHRDAKWAYSVDIENFFSTTPRSLIENVFQHLGYSEDMALLLSKLCCFEDRLAQGAPTSPALSNFAFHEIDMQILDLANKYSCKVTRYADDIVFSGSGDFPNCIRESVAKIFSGSPWKLATHKVELQPLKGRIKIHGLLVSGGNVRLTKGYRNKLRTYEHVLKTRGHDVANTKKLLGHIQYGKSVINKTGMILNAEPKESL